MRIHFGNTGKIAGADIDTCKYLYLMIKHLLFVSVV